MAVLGDSWRATWEERSIEVRASMGALEGLVYTLHVDGEQVAETTNRLKRPGTFVVEAKLGAHALTARVKQGIVRTTVTATIDGEPLALQPQKKSRVKKVLAVLTIAFVVTVVALSIPTVFATPPEVVAAELEAFADREDRNPQQCDTLVSRRGCDPVAVTGSTSVDLDIPSSHPDRGLATLKGTLTLPEGPSAPHPGVLLIGGSGGHPRDPEMQGGLVVHHRPFRLYGAIRDALVARGFAVLLVDKRTCRACYPGYKPDFPAFRFGFFEDDARDGLAAMRRHEAVDGDALVLVGHSQGGATAIRMAHDEAGVAAAVTLGGTTEPFFEVVPGQLRHFAALRIDRFDLITGGYLKWKAASFESCYEAAAGKPDQPQPCLYGTTYRAFQAEAEQARLAHRWLGDLPVPVMALQGQLDRNIVPAAIGRIRQRLEGRDAEVHVVPEVGHTLVHLDDLDAPRLAPEVEERLVGFLSSVPYPR